MAIKKLLGVTALAALLAGAGIFAFQQWQQEQSGAKGLYHSNGRLEARQSHVASRVAGLLASVAVSEGDHVAQGQPLATLDSRPLQAELARTVAAIQQTRDQQVLAQAQLAQRESECVYARSQYARIKSLISKHNASVDQLDSTRMQAESCESAINAAKAAVAASASGLKVAEATRDRIQVDLDDATIAAPFSGFILYRLAEPGEMISPGGRLFTLVSDNDVYLTVFLPADIAGKLATGDDAELLMDARADITVPARISFIAPEAQFTPKTVETASERSKLMFRAKLNVDPAFLQQNSWLKSGMPGVAALHTDPGASRQANTR
ncbi:MAG TPA: efflux RND transporter periplasmic adaptor subunit [Pseudomonadales bacterium]|nr:efflux RND transporter periplasmic adaptor subunit [Pseudomonadales bacterium]